LARRGITYGKRKRREGEFADQPDAGVGILFMAYQSNIEERFEFILQRWASASNHRREHTGVDPIIGNTGLYTFTPEPVNRPADRKYANPFSVVTLKGGEYFFAPSINFLKSL
jgi:deferrochelatase/peroxidase EfeB